MLTESEVLAILEEVEAFRKGHFKFSSGLHGDTYIQCALLLKEPRLAEKICAVIAERFRQAKPDLVIGPALGGIIVAYEVARQLGVPGIFAEKEDGKTVLRRMFSIKPGQKVLVVEDVITTGLSSQEVIDLVESMGGQVIGVGAIVDRSNGSAKISVPYTALLTIGMNNYDPHDCPLCKQGLPLIKPGSRK
ncbi:orotate phosphoribosyltransferase [Sporolituus thermophilus]|uniref:Orotate phosphoribosyltransferase n=1 Tax=Sporolituus thermophilus DSM 23256 TaxID=1123285 RepID=A0A1G7LFD9_9FIRM|nr:orotate phosphoribosyltransferase [Sporolituus thermophilus]SDF48163.1 orotate phosphoribosyltransferase [Sporolituus thermophilus DSM 23256]